MPMIAISGRRGFGGFKAARIASASCFAIDGASVTAGAGGRERIHAPPIARTITTMPKTLHKMSRRFMGSALAPGYRPLKTSLPVVRRGELRVEVVETGVEPRGATLFLL